MRILVLLLLAGLSGEAAAAPRPRAVVIDRVALVVNDVPIFESQIVRATGALGIDREAAEATLIDEALLLCLVDSIGATVSDAEVDAALAEVKAQNNLDDAQLAAALADQKYTLADYREELGHQILRLRVEHAVVFAEVGTFGSDYEETRAHVMAIWLPAQRARAFIERPVAR